MQVAKLSDGFKRLGLKIDWIMGSGVEPRVDEESRLIAKFLPEVEGLELGRANRSFLLAAASFSLASVMVGLATLLLVIEIVMYIQFSLFHSFLSQFCHSANLPRLTFFTIFLNLPSTRKSEDEHGTNQGRS